MFHGISEVDFALKENFLFQKAKKAREEKDANGCKLDGWRWLMEVKEKNWGFVRSHLMNLFFFLHSSYFHRQGCKETKWNYLIVPNETKTSARFERKE